MPAGDSGRSRGDFRCIRAAIVSSRRSRRAPLRPCAKALVLRGALPPHFLWRHRAYAMVMLRCAPLDVPNVLLLVGISAMWWGIWALITWLLLGTPKFWRRRAHASTGGRK